MLTGLRRGQLVWVWRCRRAWLEWQRGRRRVADSGRGWCGHQPLQHVGHVLVAVRARDVGLGALNNNQTTFMTAVGNILSWFIWLEEVVVAHWLSGCRVVKKLMRSWVRFPQLLGFSLIFLSHNRVPLVRFLKVVQHYRFSLKWWMLSCITWG